MKNEKEIIKLAKIKNGRDFEKWLETTPTFVPDVKKIREITRKLPYSMVEETSE